MEIIEIEKNIYNLEKERELTEKQKMEDKNSDNNDNTFENFEKDFTYDREPGNDFTYDNHGNVIYGKGFIGAPRLPLKQFGINVSSFLNVYLSFNKNIRLNVLKKLQKHKNSEIRTIRKILVIYDDLKKNKKELENKLNNYTISLVGSSFNQLSFFIDILHLMRLEKAKQFKNILIIN